MTAERPATPSGIPYQYVTLRCVPRVDRGELVNVGVVVCCEAAGYLASDSAVDDTRLLALDPNVDLDAVRQALAAVDAVCRGAVGSGADAEPSVVRRFGHLSAPRSTVVQPGPVHSGITSAELPDGPAVLEHLLDRLVRPPGVRLDG